MIVTKAQPLPTRQLVERFEVTYSPQGISASKVTVKLLVALTRVLAVESKRPVQGDTCIGSKDPSETGKHTGNTLPA